MINDNALGDILNEYKNKSKVSETANLEIPNTSIPTTTTSIGAKLLVDALDAFKDVLSIFLAAFVFGYSLHILFMPALTFNNYIIIGVAINTIMTYIHNLIHSKNSI